MHAIYTVLLGKLRTGGIKGLTEGEELKARNFESLSEGGFKG